MKDLLIMKNSYFTREKARNYTSSVDIADNKAKNYNMMFNHDYQQTQKNFNLGLDFLVASNNFKNIKIPKDLKFKNLFRIIVSTRE